MYNMYVNRSLSCTKYVDKCWMVGSNVEQLYFLLKRKVEKNS